MKTLSEHKDILLMKFDIEASESTICHLLNHELDLTLKLVTIDRAEKYTEENELMAMQCWQDTGICEPSTVRGCGKAARSATGACATRTASSLDHAKPGEPSAK